MFKTGTSGLHDATTLGKHARYAVHRWLRSQDKWFFLTGIQTLVHMWFKCIAKQVNYIKKTTGVYEIKVLCNSHYHLINLHGSCICSLLQSFSADLATSLLYFPTLIFHLLNFCDLRRFFCPWVKDSGSLTLTLPWAGLQNVNTAVWMVLFLQL